MNCSSERIRKGVDLFTSGYNCAQSVVCAFCEEFGVPHATGQKLASGFGGGIGGLRRTCGAFSGAVIIIGLLYGDYDPNDKVKKREFYQIIKEAEKKFTERFQTSICKELLINAKSHFEDSPMARTPEYYASRPCTIFVAYACEILEELLADYNKK